jgi:hypothetical protein
LENKEREKHPQFGVSKNWLGISTPIDLRNCRAPVLNTEEMRLKFGVDSFLWLKNENHSSEFQPLFFLCPRLLPTVLSVT